MAAKLTKAQSSMLEFIAAPAFLSGLAVYGPREFRTAKSLHRRGLAYLSAEDLLTITDAGRTALSQHQGGTDA